MLKIYADSHIEGNWFKELTSILKSSPIVKIGPRGSNPPMVEQAILYDRPDIILVESNRPVLILEKTREVPTGHNVGQRMGRIVKAAELGIPAIYFFPFDAKKHGDYSSICNLNARLLGSFEMMTRIHNVPILAINWPVDEYYELIDDGSENTTMQQIIHSLISSGFNHSCEGILSALSTQKEEYTKRILAYPKYKDPPLSVKITSTESFLKVHSRKLDQEMQSKFRKLSKTVIYEISMKPISCRREDPYTGMQFIYDYIWCRSGPTPEEKTKNLILYFPLLSKEIWMQNNPNNIMRKSFLWYATANALVFNDGAIWLR